MQLGLLLLLKSINLLSGGDLGLALTKDIGTESVYRTFDRRHHLGFETNRSDLNIHTAGLRSCLELQ